MRQISFHTRVTTKKETSSRVFLASKCPILFGCTAFLHAALTFTPVTNFSRRESSKLQARDGTAIARDQLFLLLLHYDYVSNVTNLFGNPDETKATNIFIVNLM